MTSSSQQQQSQPQKTHYQKIDLYDKLGFVELKYISPDPNLVTPFKDLECFIADIARVSTGTGDDKNTTSSTTTTHVSAEANKKLAFRLFKDKHTSPFEFVDFIFRIKAPLFVVQQLLRHRTASVNQESFRYSACKHKPFFPILRKQDLKNKQKSGEFTEADINANKKIYEECVEKYEQGKKLSTQIIEIYNFLIAHDVAREVARVLLPTASMTVLYWKIDLHNLIHFLRLRMAHDAQYEIRVLANAIFNLVKDYVPNIMKLLLEQEKEKIIIKPPST